MSPFKISLLFTALLFQTVLFGQEKKGLGEKSLEVVTALEAIHISPIGINDTLSQRIFNESISLMTSELMLTAQDYEILKKFKYEIDNQILLSQTTFFDTLCQILNRNAKYLEKNIKDLVTTDDLLNSDLTISFVYDDDIAYAQSYEALLEKWKKHIIFNAIRKAFNAFPETKISDKDSLSHILKFGLTKQVEANICNLQIFSDTVGSKEDQDLYLEAIALSYDPHSSYFSYDTKASFEEMLSTSEERFGFGIDEDEGIWKISFIKPGSDAWQAGSVNIGDIVTSIKNENGDELISNCATLNNIAVQLASIDCKTVELTVTKMNTEKITVKITKKLFASTENQMSGLILQQKKKIGYISLPSFYSNWDGYQVDGCANDVAKEILKLKRDSIEGLILDLRNNGGGSVTEAIDLAGIFVDLGPMGIVKYSEGKPKLLKDFNRGRVYSGPLIILVNGSSASASEIVAGALQYHKRALIVGSSTYGKATGQIVIPSDTTTWASYFMGLSVPENYIKVTQSRFYSPSNNTHQNIGIQPDIAIPTLWDTYYTKESEKPHTLAHPKIVKNVYFEPSLSLPYEELKANSKSRIANDSSFTAVTHYIDSINNTLTEDVNLSLKFNDIWDYLETRDKNIENLFEINTKKDPVFEVGHSKFNNQLNNMDDEFKKMITDYKIRLEKDLTLNESYLIMLDLINKK